MMSNIPTDRASDGRIEEVPVVDMLRLLHASGKTARLILSNGDHSVFFTMRDGKITSARDDGLRIGEVLVELGYCSKEVVADGLEHQGMTSPPLPLVSTLVELGLLSEADGWAALEQLVQRCFAKVVGWQSGTFEVNVDLEGPNDEFFHVPDVIAVPGGINAQTMLLELLRVLDEAPKDPRGDVQARTPLADAKERGHGDANALSATKRQLIALSTCCKEMRDVEQSPTLALTVLKFMAEFMERCIVFLNVPDCLLTLGSVGFETNPGTGTKLPPPTSEFLRAFVTDGHVYHGRVENDLFIEQLHARFGRPASDEFVMVPVQTMSKTAAILYGDFGHRPTSRTETEIFDILANQAGMAYDLALARRHDDVDRIKGSERLRHPEGC